MLLPINYLITFLYVYFLRLERTSSHDFKYFLERQIHHLKSITLPALHFANIIFVGIPTK